MNQTIRERLIWWFCDTFGHRFKLARTGLPETCYHAGKAHRECVRCGRVVSRPQNDKEWGGHHGR